MTKLICGGTFISYASIDALKNYRACSLSPLPIPSASVFCSFNIKKGMKDKKNGYFCFHLHKSSHCRVTEGGSVDGLSAKDR